MDRRNLQNARIADGGLFVTAGVKMTESVPARRTVTIVMLCEHSLLMLKRGFT